MKIPQQTKEIKVEKEIKRKKGRKINKRKIKKGNIRNRKGI